MSISSHEFARLLRKLATQLRKGPDMDADLAIDRIIERPASIEGGVKSDDLPVALSALLSLSSVDKSEWISLISELGLSVDVRPRDASRDIMGKVLKVLESQPLARQKLQSSIKERKTKASPELAQALSSLLGD